MSQADNTAQVCLYANSGDSCVRASQYGKPCFGLSDPYKWRYRVSRPYPSKSHHKHSSHSGLQTYSTRQGSHTWPQSQHRDLQAGNIYPVGLPLDVLHPSCQSVQSDRYRPSWLRRHHQHQSWVRYERYPYHLLSSHNHRESP